MIWTIPIGMICIGLMLPYLTERVSHRHLVLWLLNKIAPGVLIIGGIVTLLINCLLYFVNPSPHS